MNKQELIDKLKRHLTLMSEIKGSEYDKGYEWATKQHLALIAELDEPVRPPEPKQLGLKKTIVPQFVADWYEEHKDNFEDGIYELCVQFYQDKVEPSTNLYRWFYRDDGKPIETLVMMHKFGYEVKKEKLYRAKNRHTGEYLCYCFKFFHDKNNSSENQRFTAEEKHWKELGYWGNDLYVFEEAEGGDE